MSDLVDLKPLGAALLTLDEAERYRLLSGLLAALSEQVGSGPGGQGQASVEQLGQLARKLQQLDQDKANIEDQLRTAQANLEHREKQVQAEQMHAQDLQRVVDDQHQRLVALKNEVNEIQTQLVTRNAEVHQVQVERDTLTLKLQRAMAEKGDRATMDALEQTRRQLTQQVSDLQTQLQQALADKATQYEQMQAQLQAAQNKPARVDENILATAWQRLAAEVPPLAARNVPPTKVSADRLVESFIELVPLRARAGRGYAAPADQIHPLGTGGQSSVDRLHQPDGSAGRCTADDCPAGRQDGRAVAAAAEADAGSGCLRP